MTHDQAQAETPARTPGPGAAGVSRRAALTGFAAGAGVLVVGAGAAAAAAPGPGPRGARAEARVEARAAAPDPAPGSMKLFADPGFNFAGLRAPGRRPARRRDPLADPQVPLAARGAVLRAGPVLRPGHRPPRRRGGGLPRGPPRLGHLHPALLPGRRPRAAPYGKTRLPVWFMSLDVTAVVPKIKAPTLVLDYDFEQFYPGQPRQMYDLLRSPREYVKLTEATGAQLHCSPMAPQQHCDVVFDWLADVPHR